MRCVGSNESRRVRSAVMSKLNGPSSSHGVPASVENIEIAEFILLPSAGRKDAGARVVVGNGLLK